MIRAVTARVVGIGIACVLMIPIFLSASAGQPAPLGGEFQVNTYTTDFQRFPAVAANSSGNFVVVWSSDEQDLFGYGIFGQRYDASGTPQGSEFQVNTSVGPPTQRSADVGMASGGSFVVVWEGSGDAFEDDHSGIWGRRYDSAGGALGSEFAVNTYTTGGQYLPSIGMHGSGAFVVVWHSFNQDGDDLGIFGQRYDSAGAAVGSEFQVNSYTTDLQEYPDVAVTPSGGFVVVWESYAQVGFLSHIFAQRYDSSGNKLGNEFLVSSGTISESFYNPSVASDSAGGSLIVWDGSGSVIGVFGRRYDSGGSPVGSQFVVDVTTGGSPDITSDGSSFLVTWWEGANPVDPLGGVFAQALDSVGSPIGSEFHVNTYTTGGQAGATGNGGRSGHALAGNDGTFVVVWGSGGPDQDGDGYGIFGQRLCLDGGCHNDHYACYQLKHKIKPNPKPSGTLDDQVLTGSYESCKLKFLCVPTSMNGSGTPVNPDLHYCAWQCKGGGTGTFTVTDQFGAGEVAVKKLKFILNKCDVS